MTRRAPSLSLAVALAVTLPAAAGAAVFYVGSASDPSCDFDQVNLALIATGLSTGSDEIRIANNLSYTAQDVAIGGQPVTLRGGYTNCSDTTASSTGTTLSGAGGGADTVMTIDASGAATRHRVDLVNLTLTDGEHGGLEVRGNITVVLANTHVQFNDPERGVEVHDGASLTLRTGSTVSNNGELGLFGPNGGGVLCDGAVLDIEDAHIFNNLGFFGGGVYAINGCQVDLARTTPILFGAAGGIFANQATAGGGIYLALGADLDSRPFVGRTVVHDNDAVSGAGLYLTGAGTTAELRDTLLENNWATSSGGAATVADGALLVMDRGTPDWPCPFGDRCSLLVGNRVTGASLGDGGGGLYVEDGATARLRRTIVEQNRHEFGAAGRVETGGLLEVESSVVAKNLGGTIFQVMDGTLRLKFVTATSNVALDRSSSRRSTPWAT